MSAVAAMIAACTAGGATIKRKFNSIYNEEVEPKQEPIIIEVKTKLDFGQYEFMQLDDSNKNPNDLVKFNRITVEPQSYAFYNYIKFGSRFVKEHSLFELEQKAEEFIRRTNLFERGVYEAQNKRWNYCKNLGADEVIITRCIEYAESVCTDISNICNDNFALEENIVDYWE